MKWTPFKPHRFQLSYSHNKIWLLAWPMIIANISVPLLGFVDTSVVGHLPNSSYLAGTALASLVISVLFWLLGFLRMSTTGLVAQAYGQKDLQQSFKVVLQGLGLAMILASVILILQRPIFQGLLWLTDQTNAMTPSLQAAKDYYQVRIWVAPFTLSNMVFTGFLLGLGKTRLVLFSVLWANGINLVLDILFVPILGFGVAGVAAASVIAELVQFLLLGNFVWQLGPNKRFANLALWSGFSRLLTLNSNIFVRSALLQLVLSFMTLYAVRYGTQAIAINAILMQFFLFISFTLDGIAFALEALIGQNAGKNSRQRLRLFTFKGIQLGTYFALLYTLFYCAFAGVIISLLTNLETLRIALNDYLVWIYLLPLVSFLSFILDGVFVGLAWVKAMRNSMAFAASAFFLCFSLIDGLANHGIWLAFSVFMLARGLGQLWLLHRGMAKGAI